jgi:chaperonin cofactor prefoldin
MESKHRKVEDVLQDLGKKIDQMIADSQLSKIEWKKEIDQRVEEVKKNIDTLENSAKEVLGDKERWKEVEDRIRAATNEFCDAVETAFNMKKP